MKRFILFITLGVMLTAGFAFGIGIPKQMNYQGILSGSTGNPLADSTVDVEFRIYDTPAGGSSHWVETQSVTTDDQGRFSVTLGLVTPIEDTVFRQPDRYLSINVESNGEMPRIKLVSVGYSNRVSTVDGSKGGSVFGETVIVGSGPDDVIVLGVSDPNIALELRSGTFGGEPFIDFVNDAAEDNDARIQLKGEKGLEISVDSSLTIPTGNVGIGTTSPSQKLHVAGNAQVDDTLFTSNVSSLSPLRLQTAGTTRMYIDDATGNVGVGTIAPLEDLHVVGNAHVSGNLTKEYSPGIPGLAIPIAYAHIGIAGGVISGTPNVSSVWNAGSTRYEIAIAGEIYSSSSYVTVVTPQSAGFPLMATTNSVAGLLLIRIWNTADVAIQGNFQIIVYKP